jgi:tetratricopeptide (TPR) repeat protein
MRHDNGRAVDAHDVFVFLDGVTGPDAFHELWDHHAPDESERRLRDRLAEVEAGDDADLHAQLLTQIARAEGLQRRFDEAHATLDAVEGMLTDDTPVARARCFLERGRVLNSSGEPDRSRPLFRAAWKASREAAAEYHAIDAAHMLGIVEPPEEARRWNERALEMAERATDPRSRHWIGSVANNIGWALHGAGDFAGALAMFERARAGREEEGAAGGIRVARWCIARCLRSLGRLDDALARQQALAAENEAAGQADGYVDEELGECLLALGRAAEACPHFARAHERLSADAWLAENDAPRLARIRSLSETPGG